MPAVTGCPPCTPRPTRLPTWFPPLSAGVSLLRLSYRTRRAREAPAIPPLCELDSMGTEPRLSATAGDGGRGLGEPRQGRRVRAQCLALTGARAGMAGMGR